MRRLFPFLVFILCTGLCVPIPADAGTTGTLTGTAIDATSKQPIAGAKISAASPSQIASVTSDASGHYTFLALAPDTYTISIEAKGFEGASLAGGNDRGRPDAHAQRFDDASSTAHDHSRDEPLLHESRAAGHDRRHVFDRCDAAR